MQRSGRGRGENVPNRDRTKAQGGQREIDDHMTTHPPFLLFCAFGAGFSTARMASSLKGEDGEGRVSHRVHSLSRMPARIA